MLIGTKSNIPFKAELSVEDKGRWFKPRQVDQLKGMAKLIGTDKDKLLYEISPERIIKYGEPGSGHVSLSYRASLRVNANGDSYTKNVSNSILRGERYNKKLPYNPFSALKQVLADMIK